MLNFLFSNIIHNCDTPRPWGLYFQDSATPQMEGLVELHDNIMFYLVIILFGVGWILISIVRNYISSKSPISHKYLNHGRDVPVQKYFNVRSPISNVIFTPGLTQLAIKMITTLKKN